MAEFRLERFKYTWKGDWTAGVAYKRDDVVRVSGKSYVCVIGHVASGSFRTDLDAILPGSVPPQPQPKWVVMTSGTSFIGNWSTGIDYNLGDLVIFQSTIFICSVNHNSTSFVNDADNWIIFSKGIKYLNDWQSTTDYVVNSLVKNNGIVYKCIETHTSRSRLEDDLSSWETFYEGEEWQNDWTPATYYKKNDIVKYGGTIFRCTEAHTSNADNLDDTKFTIEAFGSQYDGSWDDEVYYNIGDIVNHNGFMYYANTNNVNSRPYADNSSDDWLLLSKNFSFVGDWSLDGIYKTGDVVLRGGNLYQALQDVGNGEDDGSTLDYLDDNTWELIIPGKSFKGDWSSGTVYSVGDIIVWLGSCYTCNFEHEASINNFPGDNGSGYEYWDLLIQAGQTGGFREKGDLLTYGPARFIDYLDSTVFDDSTFGDTRLSIGAENQTLSVSSDLEVFWRNIIDDAEQVYVSTNGVDSDDRGSFQKPFKTIRYAAEFVEDNFEPGKPVVIRVSAGKFEEIAPIIVPAGCAVNGDELRSTTIFANSPIAEYQNDYPYAQSYITHFISIVLALLEGNEITPQTGNDLLQVLAAPVPLRDADGNIITDNDGNTLFTDTDYPVSDLDAANQILELLTDYQDYIEFNTSDGITSPVISGSNTLSTEENFINAAQGLTLNKEFIVQDMFSFLINENPNINFNELRVKNDIRSLLRGIIRDIKYSGNYATIIAAKRYTNAIKGSQTEDLFYLRDTTGLRDCTTGGLEGVLNPPGVFELYQKPTGGALVSLDPGWGPEDDRTWITNRSPYVQGVTNTGFGCVGMKVDGALHNGGNRSMTANDFTQVLSDGIGAWITNNGRAELVSVFTYYCQIGYFAEDGGIIRSANGNNSYGRYGSISDGIDETETPQVVSVYNRANEAQVSAAFAGGTTDEIIAFEYSNAGEEYYNASATISGAGDDAEVVFSEFRDGAVFEARLTSPDGSSKKGGAGYLVRQGTAQELPDASSSIVLASTDVTQFLSEIQGMRIVITDGTGVGQYGYIDNFTFATKTVDVLRDSDDQPGWDHIIPGTPLATSFDLTTRYRIEPRVVATPPSFGTQSYDLFTNRTYVDAAFGGITKEYTGISGGSEFLWRDDNQSRIFFISAISDIQIQVSAYFAQSPAVPFTLRSKSSLIEFEVTAVSANTGEILELEIDGNGSNLVEGEEFDLILSSGSGDTFDGAASPAIFDITQAGRNYEVSLSSGGSGYEIGNTIIIQGTRLGGSTPDNDLRITVTDVSQDSTSSVLTFSTVGVGREGRYVSLTNAENSRYSDNGQDWTEVTLPFNGNYKRLVSGDNKFLALSHGTNSLPVSLDGVVWSTASLPESANWNGGVYGNGKFVLVATDTDVVATSTDGISWTSSSIPDDTDGGVDSTESQWGYVTYGSGKYVAVSLNDLATATSSDGITWIRNDSSTPDFGSETIISIEYGANRFVIVTDGGNTAYSFDGVTWYTGTNLSSLLANYSPVANGLKYGNGNFIVIGKEGVGNTSTIFESENGFRWLSRSLSNGFDWTALAYGTINQTPTWIVKATARTIDAVEHIFTGTTAKLRANVNVGSFSSINIWDPGSGYNVGSQPVINITDPNFTFEATAESRLGNHVLPQPAFVNRGAGYRRNTSTITISGDGFANIIPDENILTVSGIKSLPGPGVQIEIEGVEDVTTIAPNDLFSFSGVTVTDLGDDGSGNETNIVQFQISPRLETYLNITEGLTVTLREKYSQCRISGHDFLDIGTGNFEQTNYPEIYAGGNFFTAAPENEVYEANGGRVFYVSTDQDGNFRTGELFSVQQATGIVTISAEFFDLDGLSELALGGVRLGGSGTVVNEFSTDPTFAADSNNVIPTQRAIVSFLADRLSVGGESLEVNKLQAGRVLVGGTPENELNTNTGQYIIIPSDVVFDGTFETNDGAGNITTEQTAISGTIVSQMLYFKQFDEGMQ